ncbi:hypothetical protein [Allonocardiopsis opalescens]|uniref:Uncharacterized protein n=1 Tax=Allonocardiopsis opalescens TaxID=1144618 RepID=A0A2T0Q2E7_9ACTN|nr:hypothetical protein [Allonocardiopsis opalescens]PRX97977.1 hypothetical protein CLV72_105330 [Allonocardiopsis opalescens]
MLSQSLRKKDDGLRLGADHYYATADPATFKELAGRFDLIVNTSTRAPRTTTSTGPRPAARWRR